MKRADAEKILHANLVNVVRKTQAGTVLSQRELDLVQAQINEPEKQVTVKELCAALTISKPTYYEWKKDPEAPTDRGVQAWQEYKLKRQTLGSGSGQYTVQQLADLKGQLLAERTLRETAERKLKEIQLKRAEEGWVPLEQAETAIKRVLEPLSRLLDVLPKAWAMQVNPADPDHAESMLREMVGDVKQQMQAKRGVDISKRKGVK
tara:strand:- start:867 stop:1484 length:618 start_codon:yes stop_codon:yes gene_type:complete